ncbi:MAG: YfiR family protein [Bacteroidota bacterium]
MRTALKVSLIALCLLFAGQSTYAQGDRPQEEIYSMMIYNFLKYIEWPGNAQSGDFVIGVIGDDAVYNTLTKWYSTKKKGTQSIVIKKFSSIDQVNCHMVFMGKSMSKEFDKLKDQLSGKNTLIVTNKSGLGAKGSGINFKIENNRLKFELNKSSITASKLKVSSKLMGMAEVI